MVVRPGGLPGLSITTPRRLRFSLQQVMAFAEEGSLAFFTGASMSRKQSLSTSRRVAEASRSGKGVGWHQAFRSAPFSGTKALGPATMPIWSSSIPALEGVEAELKAGANVADVGCGHGASTIVMAKAYPKSEFFGFDYGGAFNQTGRELAAEAGIGNRIHFRPANAEGYPREGIRPRRVLRLPARHRRTPSARASMSETRWPRRRLDDRSNHCPR